MSRIDLDLREGEQVFPGEDAVSGDAALRFIGTIRSPWADRSHCPKNLREARERGGFATVEIHARYREAMTGLAAGDWVHLLTWLDRARRDLALQMPRHALKPHGTFSLRSPVRPNPIGLHLVRVLSVDEASGRMEVDAIDVLDETPLLDIKPYLATVDMPPNAPADGD